MTTTRSESRASRRRWAFIGADALPVDPVARARETRGRRWLLLSYLLCPCHLPVTLVALGALAGGTAFGAALTGNAFRVGVALTIAYGLAVWRGLRHIRWAKRIEAAGGRVDCAPEGCEIVPADGVAERAQVPSDTRVTADALRGGPSC